MSTPIRFALYARAPGPDAAVAEATIARLQALLTPRVPAHRALTMTTYVDTSEPGFGPPGPALQRLLDDARDAKLDAVLVDHLRALAMVPRQQAVLVNELAANGVQVIAEEFVRAWPVVRPADRREEVAE